GQAFPVAAAVSGATLAGPYYQGTLGARGEIASARDAGGRQLGGGSGLNDFGSGSAAAPGATGVGPGSAALHVEGAGTPARRVAVTVFHDIDRIEIVDEVLGLPAQDSHYSFDVNVSPPALRFEEVGAVARPGLGPQGDFLPGTRADYMTLNHFVTFNDPGYT